jgi:GxxExxY protein
VIGVFFDVYNTLGFGSLEHLHVQALERELSRLGHQVAREVGVRVMYRGEELGFQRLDLIVDDRLIVETKSTYDLHKAARRQLFNYLRATNLEVGVLLHFGPTPRFFRIFCANPTIPSGQSVSPQHPDEPSSVGPARAVFDPSF